MLKRVMDAFRSALTSIQDAFGVTRKVELSAFQKSKLLHEFNTFFDINKDGRLQWKDFELAREYICTKSGWSPQTVQWNSSRELFIELWRSLQDTADENTDGEITVEEWFQFWTKILNAKREWEKTSKTAKRAKKPTTEADDNAICRAIMTPDTPPSDDYIPCWVERFIQYKFSLLDRAGDGVLDEEEFEYAMSDACEISPRDMRTAFMMFSLNGEKKVDLAYFRELELQFYLSDNPSDLGNFINGKLQYE